MANAHPYLQMTTPGWQRMTSGPSEQRASSGVVQTGGSAGLALRSLMMDLEALTFVLPGMSMS